MTPDQELVDEVKSVLSFENAKSARQITEAIYGGNRACSECGKLTDGYKETHGEVKDALRQLLNRAEIVSTPDWNYELAERRDDDPA